MCLDYSAVVPYVCLLGVVLDDLKQDTAYCLQENCFQLMLFYIIYIFIIFTLFYKDVCVYMCVPNEYRCSLRSYKEVTYPGNRILIGGCGLLCSLQEQ